MRFIDRQHAGRNTEFCAICSRRKCVVVGQVAAQCQEKAKDGQSDCRYDGRW